MKAVKVSFAVLVAALMAIGVATQAQAFHSGGVAECEGCHSMHNSYENQPNVTGLPQFQSGPYLLKAQDQSGACLNCHQSADTAPTGYHISTANITEKDATTPVEMTPGGDFAWLKKTMDITIRGTTAISGNEGDRHGHNIVAVDFGYTPDKTMTVAPGGTYPASSLACSSCHDPHGTYRRFADGSQARTGLPIFNSGSYTNSKEPIAGVAAVGVYRLLGGVGYQPKSLTGSYAFTSVAPYAVAKSTYNGTSTSTTVPSGQVDLVAYGFGISEWCANCHTSMHNDTYTSGTKGLVHPAGNGAKLTAAIAANYTAYVSSGVMTGTGANYSALAPFEIGDSTNSLLKTFANNGPTAAATTNNVACVSCHRSHASGFESMARYSLTNEFMTVADASNVAKYDDSTTENKVNYGYNTQQQINAYNGRPASVFGPYARNYCNKCHAKD